MSAGALAGITVIDLSRILGGPYCTQILADHGAEVIKVEPPAGDDTRSWGPPFVAPEVSSYFAGINRNKRMITLDLRTEEGKEALHGLLAGADVLVENFKTGTLAKWGLDPVSDIPDRYPHLVHASITGFGDDGPLGGRPGYDAIIQAMSGLMSVNGNESTGPMRIGMPAVDMVTGLNAAIGVLMALQERVSSGRGQRVETTLFDCGIAVMHPHLPNFFGGGAVPKLSGNDHPNIAPYSAFATGAGQVFITAGNDGQFAKLVDHLGAPGLARDPRFVDNAARLGNRDALRVELEALMVSTSAEALSEELMAIGVPAGPILDAAEVVEHPHTAHREMVVEMGDGYRGVASPIKLARTPASYRISPVQPVAGVGDQSPADLAALEERSAEVAKKPTAEESAGV